MKTFRDQLNRIIQPEHVPERIVSLVPSQTELLHDMGLEERIVGITKFCVRPLHFKKTKTIVGGTKKVRTATVKTLQPDVILCNKEENTPEMVRELEKIAPVHISDVYTVNDSLKLIRMYGELFSKPEKANAIITAIRQKRDNFTAYMADKPVLNAAYFIWKNPWMAAAKNTFIDAMLALNKFENCYGHLQRYPEIDFSTAPPQLPDIVLLSSEPYPFKEKHKEEIKRFFPAARVLLVDGEMFSWYGSRLVKAFDYFKELHRDM